MLYPSTPVLDTRDVRSAEVNACPSAVLVLPAITHTQPFAYPALVAKAH